MTNNKHLAWTAFFLFPLRRLLFLFLVIPFTLLLAFLLASCGTLEPGVENPNNFNPTPSETPQSSPTPTITPEPFTYNELPAGAFLDPTLAGMVYNDSQGVWMVDGKGQSRFIGERNSYPVLSPDGKQILYTSNDETIL